MKIDDYKTILYCQEDGSWVADIPAISGCYALMPTRQEALAELTRVFEMIAEEYQEAFLKMQLRVLAGFLTPNTRTLRCGES